MKSVNAFLKVLLSSDDIESMDKNIDSAIIEVKHTQEEFNKDTYRNYKKSLAVKFTWFYLLMSDYETYGRDIQEEIRLRENMHKQRLAAKNEN